MPRWTALAAATVLLTVTTGPASAASVDAPDVWGAPGSTCQQVEGVLEDGTSAAWECMAEERCRRLGADVEDQAPVGWACSAGSWCEEAEAVLDEQAPGQWACRDGL